MNKKNGFIATSLIYSFFLIFITLFLTVIADYLQNKVLLNTIESEIKKDINETININYFKVGDQIFFPENFSSLNCGSSLDNLTPCSELKDNLYEIYDLIATNDKTDVLELREITMENGEKKVADTSLYLEVGIKKFKVNSDAIDGSITITEVKE